MVTGVDDSPRGEAEGKPSEDGGTIAQLSCGVIMGGGLEETLIYLRPDENPEESS